MLKEVNFSRPEEIQSIEELRAYISEGLEHPIYGELFEQILLDFEDVPKIE